MKGIFVLVIRCEKVFFFWLERMWCIKGWSVLLFLFRIGMFVFFGWGISVFLFWLFMFYLFESWGGVVIV